jgi:hypothetical protein
VVPFRRGLEGKTASLIIREFPNPEAIKSSFEIGVHLFDQEMCSNSLLEGVIIMGIYHMYKLKDKKRKQIL